MEMNSRQPGTDRPTCRTGASLTDAVRKNIRMIQQQFAAKRPVDSRPADEIIGYDEHGLPG